MNINKFLRRHNILTILQVVKFYTVVKKILKKLTFRTVVLRRSECMSHKLLSFTQSQETQKIIVIAAMLVSQTKEIIKIILLRVLQHDRHDVR